MAIEKHTYETSQKSDSPLTKPDLSFLHRENQIKWQTKARLRRTFSLKHPSRYVQPQQPQEGQKCNIFLWRSRHLHSGSGQTNVALPRAVPEA